MVRKKIPSIIIVLQQFRLTYLYYDSELMNTIDFILRWVGFCNIVHFHVKL
jgi:hypothetical protein